MSNDKVTTTSTGMIVNDHTKRQTDAKFYAYALATDKFMSGWGQAPRSSYVAYKVYHGDDLHHLLKWMGERGDYIRVRTGDRLTRGYNGCHTSIYDVPEQFQAK